MPAVSGIPDRQRFENRLAIRDALPIGTGRHDGFNSGIKPPLLVVDADMVLPIRREIK
jgi:hypothetical protein